MNILDAYRDAQKTGVPQVYAILPNGVHIIITPNGAMHNVWGEENAQKIIKDKTRITSSIS